MIKVMMKKIWKRLGNKPIGTKLNIFFTVLIIVPIALFGIVVSVVIANIQTEHIQTSAVQYLEQSRQGINNSLTELDSVVGSNLWNEELRVILNYDRAYVASPEQKNIVQRILKNMVNTRKDIACIVIMTEGGEQFSYLENVPWSVFGSYISRTEPEWEGTAKEKYERCETIWLATDTDYFMGIRQIRDFTTLAPSGWMYLFVDKTSILQQYEELKTASGSFFVVSDTKGSVISTDYSGEEVPDQQAGQGRDMVKLDNVTYYLEELTDDETLLTIREYTPRSAIIRDILRLDMFLVSVILVLLGILFLLIRHFSLSITQPIRELQEKMQKVQNGNLDVTAEAYYEDEIGELAGTFNIMTTRIRKLIEKDYQNVLLLREAEFKFLRAQINPHFLYNTLDSISWMSAMGENKEAGKMAVALGRIMRWAISNTENKVLLREEAEVLADYLSIQKMRYGDSLKCEVSLKEPELSMQVPKMILQPLAENALIHGLESLDGEKRLEINARTENGELWITVMDYGVGMPPEKVQEILSGKVRQKKNHGVGIYNVHQRIRLSFGERYGLRIKSEPGCGTEVRIVLPAGMKNEDESDDCGR